MEITRKDLVKKRRMIKKAKRIYIFSRPYELYLRISKNDALLLARSKFAQDYDDQGVPWAVVGEVLYID